ncbi:MAG: 6-carboxytetrahydropterin synthase [Candidatus Obscuribacterales bacterium]|nr:6-carboxytetrahydropterin synthase [Candidatus Obscuribacterales bacterium]
MPDSDKAVMPAVTAVRRLQFCAGHRVYRHESKCSNLHGHNYVLFLHATTNQLDELGRVIDFGVLKSVFAPWIERNWDHGFIVWQDDEPALAALKQVEGQKVFRLSTNPTAENMALFLLHELGPQLLSGTSVTLSKVVLWETENCYVEVSL